MPKGAQRQAFRRLYTFSTSHHVRESPEKLKQLVVVLGGSVSWVLHNSPRQSCLCRHFTALFASMAATPTSCLLVLRSFLVAGSPAVCAIGVCPAAIAKRWGA